MTTPPPLVLVATSDEGDAARFAALLEVDARQVQRASSPEDAVTRARDLDPTIIVVDCAWRTPRPSTAGVDDADWDWEKALRAAAPRTKVLLVAPPAQQAAAWAMVRHGALDCLPPDAPDERWRAALHNALARGTLEREGTAWREIQALLEVSHAVTSGEDLSRTLQRIMDSAMTVTGADSGSLMLLAADAGDALEIAAARGLPSEVVAGTRIRAGEGIAGWVAKHGEPLLIREGLANDARFKHLPQREEIRSSVCVPVRSRPGATIGVLCLNTVRTRRRFSHRDLTLMLIYAGAVGTLIEAARALEGERRTTRQLERALNRQRATEGQLIQSAKMAAVGLLASGIAHEFNNLLTGILGMAQIAQDTQAPRHVERALRVAVDNCRKARDVVKNLLSFAKPYSKPGSAVEAGQAIDTVLALVNREISSRGIRVVRRLHPAPPVRAARGGLEQVLLNLILNAVQAMEGRRDGVLTVGVRARRSDVVLAVADTGHGIKPEHLSRIFDPFFSTKSLLAGQAQPQGAGLGLSVSYGIVRGFGGRIAVRSREHRGTLFTVRLPMATEADLADVRPQTRRLPRVAGGRVLVVDDEWWIREFLRECLSHAGYEVAVAGDGAEAVSAAQDRAPDAMLVDIVLADGERGDDVVAELRRAAPHARVVYMTGRVAGDAFERKLRDESEGFLAKPFEAHEVVAALQLALGEEAPRA